MNPSILRTAGIRALTVLGSLGMIAMTGCSGSDSQKLGPPLPPDEALGGLWFGTSNDQQITAISTDGGLFRWIDWDSGEQGFGVTSSDEMALTLSYAQVPALFSLLPDGSESANCTGTGTIGGREQMSIVLDCETDLGLAFTADTSLAYDSEFERDSGLTIVSGHFDDDGVVMTVSSGGQIFEQDPFTGCVTNGLIRVLDREFNVYEVSLSYANCRGDYLPLNGTSFDGLATLISNSDSALPEELLIAVTGEVDGMVVSRPLRLTRT